MTETLRPEADFEEFVRTRSDALFGTALLLTGDRHLAEDLLQTALTQAWRSWGSVHTSHEGVVRRTMVNTYLTWWRRRWNGERPTEELPEHAGPATDHDAHLDLHDAVRRLPKRQRAVVVLRYFEDLPEAEVAAILGCSVGTVKSQAHRALAKLRDDVGRVEGGNPHRYEEVEARVRTSRARRATAGALLVLLVIGVALATLVVGNGARVDPAPRPSEPTLRSVLDQDDWRVTGSTSTRDAYADVRLARGDDRLHLTWNGAADYQGWVDDLASGEGLRSGTVPVLGEDVPLYQTGSTYQLVLPPGGDGTFLYVAADLRRVELEPVLAALRTDEADVWLEATGSESASQD